MLNIRRHGLTLHVLLIGKAILSGVETRDTEMVSPLLVHKRGLLLDCKTFWLYPHNDAPWLNLIHYCIYIDLIITCYEHNGVFSFSVIFIYLIFTKL